MCHVATDLSPGDPLLYEDEVARYCRPLQVEEGTPTHLAFIRRAGEDDLSVNRLQSFLNQDRPGAVDCIRQTFPLKRGTAGRFVVLHVGHLIASGQRVGPSLHVTYNPEEGNPSHTLVQGYPDDYGQEVGVATALLRLVTRADIFAGGDE